jgi:mgtE-like transporter
MTIRTKIQLWIKALGQSLLSLSFNLAGLLAGTLLASHLDVFSLTPWALLLFPGILSVRGAIGGLFSGRLGTALHVGTVRPSFTKNTKSFHQLYCAITVLTLGSSIAVGLTTSLFGAFLMGTTALDSLAILAITNTTMGFSLVSMSPITLGISVLSFKRGLDPDVIVYPVISTVADVLVAVCYILVLESFFSSQLGRILIGLFNLALVLVVCYIWIRNRREQEFVKTVREFSLTLLLVAFIVNLTGSVLSKVSQVIGGRPEVYVAYPALIDTVGDVGSIVGSTATTKLALGTIEPSLSGIKEHLPEIGGAWLASLIMFILYAVAASIHTAPSQFLRLVAELSATNILAVSSMVLISFAVALSTRRRGWDPDNFVIPIESSMADTITTVSLLLAVTAAA